MSHLSADQLVDIAEGARPESSAPHLQACVACRRQLADLCAMMSAVAEVAVPEPSPLFWDHLSSRVHDAVEAEREAAASGLAGWSWVWRPLVWMPGIAALALTVAVWSQMGGRPAPGVPPAPSTEVAEPAEAFNLADDPSLSLVADLAAELDWDAAAEAGLTTHVGVDDDVVLSLSDGERRELHLLLRTELGRPGGQRGA